MPRKITQLKRTPDRIWKPALDPAAIDSLLDDVVKVATGSTYPDDIRVRCNWDLRRIVRELPRNNGSFADELGAEPNVNDIFDTTKTILIFIKSILARISRDDFDSRASDEITERMVKRWVGRDASSVASFTYNLKEEVQRVLGLDVAKEDGREVFVADLSEELRSGLGSVLNTIADTFPDCETLVGLRRRENVVRRFAEVLEFPTRSR